MDGHFTLKILVRYLFVSLLKAFAFCLVACLLLPFIFDLFGSLNEFLQNRSQFPLVASYYAAFVPNMLPMVMPPALLFATLYTLLDLNRTSQLVAMQACGVSIGTIFVPFLLTGVLCSLLLYGLSLSIGGGARARQNAIMNELRAQPGREGVHAAQVYHNREANRTWYIQALSLKENTAQGVDVCEQDAAGKDVREVFARQGAWDPAAATWSFSDALVETFDAQQNVATRQIYENFTPPDWHDEPKSMIRLLLRPEEMSVRELQGHLDEGGLERMVRFQYRTQIWEFLVYPLAALVLMCFALPQGLRYDRRSVGAGVFNAIFLLIAFYIVWNFFVAMGAGGRIAAPLAVGLPMGGFAAAALFRIVYLLGFGRPVGFVLDLFRKG